LGIGQHIAETIGKIGGALTGLTGINECSTLIGQLPANAYTPLGVDFADFDFPSPRPPHAGTDGFGRQMRRTHRPSVTLCGAAGFLDLAPFRGDLGYLKHLLQSRTTLF
jgi:hypothetical protein